MSRWTENECVGCPPNMGCLGSACPNREVEHCECDECHEEIDPDDAVVECGSDYCPECYRKIMGIEEDE